jgi:DNA topoisomerase-2
LLYKDNELLTPKIDEGVEIEPEYFLPIIPTIIINGTSGIAVGFGTNILNRNPYDVIDACVAVLEGKKQKVLKPYINEFNGEWILSEENEKSWIIKGIYEIVNTTTVHISELPPNHTYESYEKFLDGLEDKGVIVSYDDNSSDKINYTLKFQRATLKELIDKGKLEQKLGLIGKETENLTTIDENQNVKVFDSANEIVEYFVNFRLSFYQKRKDYQINKAENELLIISNKARFIKAIIENKLKVKNTPKAEIEQWLEDNSFDKINDSFNYLLQMQIYSLTKEKYEELLKEKELKKQEIENIKKQVPKQMYLDDLSELKQQLKKLKI